jgi:hypothetical protein
MMFWCFTHNIVDTIIILIITTIIDNNDNKNKHDGGSVVYFSCPTLNYTQTVIDGNYTTIDANTV